MMPADQVIELLGLEPHPEGGFFAETYRATLTLPEEVLPSGYAGPRAAGTAIFYLIKPDNPSRMHRVRSDEIFHFYLGDPAEMLLLDPNGEGRTLVLGPDLAAGQRPQAIVPGGVWQGTRVLPGGAFALLGATVAPGFDYDDFKLGDRDALMKAYPAHAEALAALT